MSQKFIRVYKKLDIDEISAHLIICGDLSSSCGNCKEVNLKYDMPKCPKCNTEFKYVTFRNVKDNIPKMQKIAEASPEMVLVDFDDFKRITGALKAERFLK